MYSAMTHRLLELVLFSCIGGVVSLKHEYELIGNGWCSYHGQRIGLYSAGWQTTSTHSDGGATWCEQSCDTDPACIGYSTVSFGTKCQLHPGNMSGKNVNIITGVDNDTRYDCWWKKGVSRWPSIWSLISDSRPCEMVGTGLTSEGIARSFGGVLYSLDACKRKCLGNTRCKAIDFLKDTGWCSTFEQPCVTPAAAYNGASSYVFDQAAQPGPIIWSIISASLACEANSEGITSTSDGIVYSLDACKRRCLGDRRCRAIDFFNMTGKCNIFDHACSTPLSTGNGASSYALDQAVALGTMGFVLGIIGSNSCPLHYSPVMNVTKCQSAAQVLGIQFSPFGSHMPGFRPAGCFRFFSATTGDSLFFNHASGGTSGDDQRVCEAFPTVVADPAIKYKKCGVPGSPDRVFVLRWGEASEHACRGACAVDASCVAFSGVFGLWCIGCKSPLSESHGDSRAVAYKKEPTTTTTISTTISLDYTTSLTASVPMASVEGEVVLKVNNVSQFIKEPNLTAVLTTAIAHLMNVSVDWVQDVIVNVVSLDRRLLLHADHNHAGVVRMQGRMLTGIAPNVEFTTKSGVSVRFRVVIPPSGEAQITATILTSRFNALTSQEASIVINSILCSGFLGPRYVSKVEYKYASVQQPSASPAPQESQANTIRTRIFVTVLLSAFTGLLFFVGVLRIWIKRRRRHMNISRRSVEGPAEWSLSEFLSIPDSISAWSKTAMDNFFISSFAGAEAQVYVTFALGHRMADVQDTGPGLFYAAAVGKALLENGISCSASLRHVSFARRQEDAADLIVDPTSQIKILIVVETLALYQSEWCLREIFAALESNVEIIRFRFEAIPDGYERWPQVNLVTGDIRHLIGTREFSLEDIKRSVLQKFDVVSPPPSLNAQHMIQQHENFLENFVADVQSKMKGGQPSSLKQTASQGPACALDAGERVELIGVQTFAQRMSPEIQIPCQADTRAAPTSEGIGKPCERGKENGMTPRRRGRGYKVQSAPNSIGPASGGQVLGDLQTKANSSNQMLNTRKKERILPVISADVCTPKSGRGSMAQHIIGANNTISPTLIGHDGREADEQVFFCAQSCRPEVSKPSEFANSHPASKIKTRRRDTAQPGMHPRPIGYAAKDLQAYNSLQPFSHENPNKQILANSLPTQKNKTCKRTNSPQNPSPAASSTADMSGRTKLKTTGEISKKKIKARKRT